MLRKISLTLLCAAVLSSTPTYSMMTSPLHAGVTIEYEFLPNDPLTLVNYMYWEIEANCTMRIEDPSDDFQIEVLAKRSSINGTTLSKGESIKITVHADDILKLTAESGAKVKITNLGKHLAKATCVS